MFRDGWTIEAAEAIAGDRSQSVIDGLERLVEQSLIRMTAQPDGTARYSMLETIREFGLEQLIDNGEEESVRQQLARYVLELVESLEQLYDGSEQILALDRLEQEHANIRAALDWFVSRREAERGLRLAGSLWMFWQIRGYLSEGRQQYERLLALADDGVPARVRAHALTGAGILALWQHDFDSTVLLQEEALSIWLDLPLVDQYDVWRSLAGLGDVAYSCGDLVGAQARYEEMLTQAERVGNARGMTAGSMYLGNIVIDRGSLDEATTFYETSLARAAQAGDIWLQALSMGNLAYICLFRGHIVRARSLFEAVLDMERRMGHKRHIAASLITLGRVELLQGQTDAAATLLEEGLALANQIGARQESANALRIMGDVARQSGNLDLAERNCQEGLRITWTNREMSSSISCLESLAAIAADRGDWERAARLCGAVEHQREQLTLPLQPFEQPAYEHLLGRIRRPLSAADFERVQSEGWAMSITEAVDYALELRSHSPSMPSLREAVPAGLTPREVDVLLLVAQGLTDAEVAEQLFLARRTVNTHLTSIYTKIGVSSRAAATRFAIEHGLVSTAPVGLSKREIEVLRPLVDGRSNQEIAAILFISPHTVANHVASIMNKLGLDSRTAVATWAVRQGIV